ncbi:MAG: hypothetical protein ACRD1U_03830 [Vicinamibacterales bacterium]
MITRCALFLSAAIALGAAPSVSAQVYLGRETPHRGTIELGGGGTWAPGFDLATADAELTRATDNDRFDLFSTEGRASGFPGAHARVGVYLSRAISVEGGIRYAKPRLSYDLTDDAESAEDETAEETLSHYVFDGSVLFHFPNAAFADGRGVPFFSAGAGYLRELHEGNELVETGSELHATAGVKYWFGNGDRRMGLRAEFGISSRQGGFDDDDERRTVPIALGGVTFLF